VALCYLQKVANSEPSFSPPAGTEASDDEAHEETKSSPARKRSRTTRRPTGGNTDKRERILKAAIRVFARKGFYSTRVSEIAKAAGVADGTIYLYFKNKDDVLISIFQDRISKLLEVLTQAVAQKSSFEEKLLVVVDLQLGLLDGSRELAEVVTVNLRQSSRLLKQFGAPLFGKYLETLARVFEEGQEHGTVRKDVSPRVLARALWGALDAIALGWALGGGDEQMMRRSAQQVAATFLDGVRNR
jgi:TetR/AcrR family fatty acid metabolism transcriptional regulator